MNKEAMQQLADWKQLAKSSDTKICPQRNCKCVSPRYEPASELKQQVKPYDKRDGIVEVCLIKAV